MNPTAAKHISMPDHEFDGYAWTSDGQKILCRIAIWLPWDASGNGQMEVELFQVKWEMLEPRSITNFSAHEDLPSFSFQAFDPLIRRAQYCHSLRHTGGVRLTISRIRNWLLTTHLEAPLTMNAFEATLSNFNYGLPWDPARHDWKGNRFVSVEESPKLSLLDANGDISSVWELQKHWHWNLQNSSHVSATASPVLKLLNASAGMDAEELAQNARNICTLLSLAARHRVHIYRTVHQHGQVSEENWLVPLRRPRATTEENACGPLIQSNELSSFIEAASKTWSALTDDQKDAVRLAVFAIHPPTEQTMEARFMNLFSSLEGLGKRWIGPKKKREIFRDWYERFRDQYPIEMGPILWPVSDAETTDLYWFRNEFAHGRTVMHLPPGVLPLAIDHLQLLIEFTLLRLLGYQRTNRSDWLTAEQVKNSAKNVQLIDSVCHLSGKTPKDLS